MTLTLSEIGDAGAPSIDSLTYDEANPIDHQADRDASTILDADAEAIREAIRKRCLLRSPQVRMADPVTRAVTYREPSGTAKGWSSQAPDPTAVARSETRITRSRKGRTSFVVTRRAEHTRTAGDGRYVDPLSDTADDLSEARSEHLLVRWADALLASDELAEAMHVLKLDKREARRLRLTDRPYMYGRRGEMRPDVFGSREGRSDHDDVFRIGANDPDRAGVWCPKCHAGAEHCDCLLYRPASIGPLLNAGTRWDHGDESLPWRDRMVVARRGRRCPICASTGRHAVSPCQIVEGRTTHLLSWADHGSWIGHTFGPYVTRREAQSERKTAREAAETATQAATAARHAATDQILEALRTAGIWQGPNGETVMRERGRYVVATPDGKVTRHATPAPVLARLAS